MLILAFILPAIAVTITQGEEIKSQREVLEEALSAAGYDLNEWPHGGLGQATDVNVQMFVNSFGSLNAANMEYNLDTFLRQSWRDPRLEYKDSRPSITVTDEKMRSRIWKPDTYFENVKEAKLHTVTMPNVLFRINRNGEVMYSIRINMKLSCYMDFHNFPLDSQICDARISSYANTINVIKYRWQSIKPIDLPANLEIAQFSLLSHSTVEETYSYEVGNFSGLQVRFAFRRQQGFHILQTYIPTILLVSISWISFWLDPNSVPGRIALGVTTLLTITTLASGIRSQLPPVSYIKAIDVWVGMCMIMVFGALLEFTLSNFLANRKIPPGKTSCKIPQFEPGTDAPPKTPTTYIHEAKHMDRICRVAFPGTFLLFNLFYWPYYLLQQYKTIF